jgi:hypothetical protein
MDRKYIAVKPKGSIIGQPSNRGYKIKYQIPVEKTGPGMWVLLHNIAYDIAYVSKQSNDIYIYILNVTAKTHPCEICRTHMAEYLSKNPITNSTNVFEYMINFHNAVNIRLNKPIMSIQDALDLYGKNIETPCTTCLSDNNSRSNSTTPDNISGSDEYSPYSDPELSPIFYI